MSDVDGALHPGDVVSGLEPAELVEITKLAPFAGKTLVEGIGVESRRVSAAPQCGRTRKLGKGPAAPISPSMVIHRPFCWMRTPNGFELPIIRSTVCRQFRCPASRVGKRPLRGPETTEALAHYEMFAAQPIRSSAHLDVRKVG